MMVRREVFQLSQRARRLANIARSVSRQPSSLLKGTVAYLEVNGRIGALPTVYPFALFPAAGRCQTVLQALDSPMGGVRLSELAIVSAIAAATHPRMVFEFGTLNGRTTLNLALNTADDCDIYTLDLPEERRAEFDAGLVAQGHLRATERPSSGIRHVGHYFSAHPLGRRSRNCKEIRGNSISGRSTAKRISFLSTPITTIRMSSRIRQRHSKCSPNGARSSGTTIQTRWACRNACPS